MEKILFPLRYLTLENKSKARSEIGSALVMSLALSLPYALVNGLNYFHPNGILDKLLTLTSCLTGFYVAALVAAATFHFDDLDETMRFGAVFAHTLDDNGKRQRVALTRRQFVCHIFGYLSFLSLFISVFSAYCISTVGGKSLGDLPAQLQQAGWWVRLFAIFGVNACICHLLVVSNVGIYYMMHRIFKSRPKVITKKSTAA